MSKSNTSVKLYENSELENKLIELLIRSNDEEVCKVRADFRREEQYMLTKFISDDSQNRGGEGRILDAGSGLGYELPDLAKTYRGLGPVLVIGIEKSKAVCDLSRKYIEEKYAKKELKPYERIKTVNADFFKNPFDDEFFDYSILNSGTIGNFEDDQKINLIKELIRVTSNYVYVDFFSSEKAAFEKREKMYNEMNLGKVKLEGNRFINEKLGVFSESMTLDKFDSLLNDVGDVCRSYTRMRTFGWMVEICAEDYHMARELKK
jgi:SAM-dependent methyltransferase